ncbi:Serine/threonine-protein kinase StkP [Streptomyces sp. YIM 130001]|uniref:serine/threonine-protein kinase n=1 Tax=Streptomyces sp. YIM 130001 TaxID=2259644 RepID=UPI000E64B54E|nr:serine/threonine-protein kinase [Streptomyces sp. YIM 130001]RII21027.1 Serine/threonine-protein kinase StkP [Streptomyces sp. YIM 130001]
MSNDGGTPYGPEDPTSYGLRPPHPQGQGGAPGGNPYAQAQAQSGQGQDPYGQGHPGANGPGQPGTPGQGQGSPYAYDPTQAYPSQNQPQQPGTPPPAPQPPNNPQTPVVPTQVSAHEPPDPGAGRLIANRYRLLSKLGHGGMGTVWRAKDETVDREVAVKEPRVPDHLPERERANAFERMRREARAAARLDHPAVVNVHDVAVEDGQPWIVMEFVRGRSLGAALQEGTLGAREAARIGLEVLNALDAAHQAGILHRDVKPDNVMLGSHDRVVLTDFGIAQIEGETNLTDTGGFVGSPEFIAPERVLGQRPGPASDLWSLGVVLYASTEGVSPFRRNNTPATLQSVLNAAPAAPASAKGPLADAINRLLVKDPNQRPSTPQVRQLLEQAAKPPQPAQVVRVSGPGGGKGIGLSRKGWIAAGAVVVAAVLATVLVVVDPFAGPLPDDWKEQPVKPLGATLAVPNGYGDTEPEPDAEDEHWIRYTDPSGAVYIRLDLMKKSEDSLDEIESSAVSQAHAESRSIEDGTTSAWTVADKPAPEVDVDDDIKYEEKKAAVSTITFTDDSDTDAPLPREGKIFYYRTGKGDMYRLSVLYPGKGDFTERGREVAKTAIDNLKITKP